MEDQLARTVARFHPDANSVEIADFAPIPGGFSRETFRFDATVVTAAGSQTLLRSYTLSLQIGRRL